MNGMFKATKPVKTREKCMGMKLQLTKPTPPYPIHPNSNMWHRAPYQVGMGMLKWMLGE